MNRCTAGGVRLAGCLVDGYGRSGFVKGDAAAVGGGSYGRTGVTCLVAEADGESNKAFGCIALSGAYSAFHWLPDPYLPLPLARMVAVGVDGFRDVKLRVTLSPTLA
jgi:hypothetical protein